MIADLYDVLRRTGPEHFTMDRWCKVRRPWGEWEPISLAETLGLDPFTRAADLTVIHPFARAAELVGVTVDDARCMTTDEAIDVVRHLAGLDVHTFMPAAWGMVERDGWVMGDAFAEGWNADPDHARSDRYHATRQYWWHRTFLAYLAREMRS